MGKLKYILHLFKVQSNQRKTMYHNEFVHE